MEQRSNEWFDARLGRFTGSEINKLMTGGRRDMTEAELIEAKANKIKRKTVDVMFGDTATGYIEEKANDIVFGRDMDDSLVTFDMQRGIDLEPLAFRKVKELKGKDFIEVSECSFFVKGDNLGASPDGLVGEDSCLEIKCPRAKKFFKIVKNGASEIDPIYYDQMQTEMLVTNSTECCFFNYIVFNGKEMWHEMTVKRDEERIAEIEIRVKAAAELRDKFVEELKANIQWS